ARPERVAYAGLVSIRVRSERAMAEKGASERPDRPAASWAVGDVLRGKYRIERVLDVGGMGTVVEATNVRLDRRVAIKLLDPAKAAVPHLAARFAREARAAAKLEGEHVVRILD